MVNQPPDELIIVVCPVYISRARIMYIVCNRSSDAKSLLNTLLKRELHKVGIADKLATMPRKPMMNCKTPSIQNDMDSICCSYGATLLLLMHTDMLLANSLSGCLLTLMKAFSAKSAGTACLS